MSVKKVRKSTKKLYRNEKITRKYVGGGWFGKSKSKSKKNKAATAAKAGNAGSGFMRPFSPEAINERITKALKNP